MKTKALHVRGQGEMSQSDLLKKLGSLRAEDRDGGTSQAVSAFKFDNVVTQKKSIG